MDPQRALAGQPVDLGELAELAAPRSSDAILDVASRAGVLAAAYAAGSSTQPNLLTRGTPDQALITGISTVVTYGWAVSSNSFYRSFADRIPMRSEYSGMLVTAAAAGAGFVGHRVLAYRQDESARRAIGRLAAQSTALAGSAGVLANAVGLVPGRGKRGLLGLGLAAGVGVAAWARTRSSRASVGSAVGDGTYYEDSSRSISPGKTAALGVATGTFLFGLSKGESMLSAAFSRVGAQVLGGSPDDHRTLGRVGATAASYGVAWLGLSAVVSKLTSAGSEVETANTARPSLPEVTGSPASGIPWEKQSREGTRWLSAVLLADHISEVMKEPAKQPIRVYASLDAADTEEERANLLLRELDRTKAFERSAIALFSPTGSGYVNYVACETYEYLTRGDCASMAIEYSVLPSALSLTRTAMGTRQTQMVVDGVTERLLALPADKRPKFFLFGESLGCRVSEELFSGASDLGPRGAGIDAALWVGTPAFTRWRKTLWGGRSQAVAPEVGPGAIFLPRAVPDWTDLPPEERAKVKYLLLQNGDDPIPKFDSPLLWRQPDWLGPDDTRPLGAPRGTYWQPVTTFVATFTDMLNALTPTPGKFAEGGHDYRLEIPGAIREVWGLDASDEQMSRVNAVLRTRELAWEVKRDWDSALAQPEDKRAEAQDKVRREVGEWVGADGPVDDDTISLIVKGTEPV